MTRQPWGPQPTPYLELGDESRVRELVETFYDIIEATSPGLRGMLPEDTRSTRDKFHAFMSGWLGGPQLYVQQFGHPQLRMRHFPFAIGPAEAGEWMRCMREALDRVAVAQPLRSYLEERLSGLASHLINQPEAEAIS